MLPFFLIINIINLILQFIMGLFDVSLESSPSEEERKDLQIIYHQYINDLALRVIVIRIVHS